MSPPPPAMTQILNSNKQNRLYMRQWRVQGYVKGMRIPFTIFDIPLNLKARCVFYRQQNWCHFQKVSKSALTGGLTSEPPLNLSCV